MTKAVLRKILYVEDDESIAEVVVMTLADLSGYEVMHCSSGQKALYEVATFNPQLILMDVMMPVMDGPQTFRHLRAIPGAKAIPVIFMTAKAQLHEQESYLKLGALGVIVKPFDPMALPQQIETMWAQWSAAARPPHNA